MKLTHRAGTNAKTPPTIGTRADKDRGISRKWHRQQIEKYAALRPHYEAYANTLLEILKRAARLRAPEAIVQARAKTLSSFAEKAARKADKYDDPVGQLTDLCGARIIVHNLAQVDTMRRFMRTHFKIDEANSIDVSTRLKTAEFGYLSVHLVVTLEAKDILGVRVPAAVGALENGKAEIQVRTLLQHMWADIDHDRIYKSPVKFPRGLLRESARLAAVMENADHAFQSLTESFDAYTLNFGALMSRQEVEREIDVLKLVLENDPDRSAKPANALRLSGMYRTLEQWDKVIAVLDRHREVEGQIGELIKIELGNAYCRQHAPGSKSYQIGQGLLSRVARPDDPVDHGAEVTTAMPARNAAGNARVNAMALLARTYWREGKRIRRTRELYHKAYRLDPTNPYVLAPFLECELTHGTNTSVVALMAQTVRSAISTCQAQICGGIELPWACLCMGRLDLLLGEDSASLRAYAKAVDYCISGEAVAAASCFDEEIESLERISAGTFRPEALQWAQRLLLLARVVSSKSEQHRTKLARQACRKQEFKPPILVVAGGASGIAKDELRGYVAMLREAFRDYSGTVISGGTASGIPGAVGSVLGKSAGSDRGPALIGYVPAYTAVDVGIDRERYSEIVKTDGRGFSFLETLQYWTDLISQGIGPKDIWLLGIGGGEIAAFEYRLALALGATVGVLESSGGAASELARDELWSGHESLFVLPHDPMTLWAFVDHGRKSEVLTKSQVDSAAKAVHDRFREMKRTKITDPSFLDWEELREDFKNSNRQQVTHMEEILRRAGYRLCETADRRAKGVAFTRAEIDKMANMEHGRWIVERLGAGWRYGPRKDEENRISPYLVAWSDLPESIKDYDRSAVAAFPTVLASVGLGICKAKKGDK